MKTEKPVQELTLPDVRTHSVYRDGDMAIVKLWHRNTYYAFPVDGASLQFVDENGYFLYDKNYFYQIIYHYA